MEANIEERKVAKMNEIFTQDPGVLSQLGDSHMAHLMRHSLLTATHFAHVGIGYPIRTLSGPVKTLHDILGPYAYPTQEDIEQRWKEHRSSMDQMADDVARTWKAAAKEEEHNDLVDITYAPEKSTEQIVKPSKRANIVARVARAGFHMGSNILGQVS